MLTRLERKLRRQIATGYGPAVITLRLGRDGETLLEIRKKRARRGHSFNLSVIATRLLKLPSGTLNQTDLFALLRRRDRSGSGFRAGGSR